MFQPLIYSEKFLKEDAYDAAHHSAFPKQSIFAGEPGIGLGPPAAPPALPPRPRVRLVEPGGARLERAHGGPGAPLGAEAGLKIRNPDAVEVYRSMSVVFIVGHLVLGSISVSTTFTMVFHA